MISSIFYVSSTAIYPPRFTWWLRTTPAHHLADFFWGGSLLFLLSSWSAFFGLGFYLVGFLVFLSGDLFKNKKWLGFLGPWTVGICSRLDLCQERKAYISNTPTAKLDLHFCPLETGSFFAKNPISMVWIPRKQTLRGLGKKMSPIKAGVLGNHHSGFMFNFGGAMKNQKWCCLEKRHLLENDCCNFNPQWPPYSKTNTKLMIRVWWMRWSLQWLIIFPLTGFITDKHSKNMSCFDVHSATSATLNFQVTPSKPGDAAEVTPERKPMPQRILFKDDPLHLKANN